MLIEMGAGTTAPYFHASWVLLDRDMAQDELRGRLLRSFSLIRSFPPKMAQFGLSGFPEG